MQFPPTMRAAALSDSGCKRSVNEDKIWFDLDDRAFVLADGMGGERCGAYASELVVSVISSYIKGLRNEPSWPFGYDIELNLSQDVVITAIRASNRAVWEAGPANPECAGMGSTVSFVYISGSIATIGNVGDSRVYLARYGELHALTRDDLVINGLIERGEVKPESVGTHPLRNVLSHAVG